VTQEELNIIVDSVKFSAPVYASRIIESLDNFIKDYNSKVATIKQLEAKQAETKYQQVEMDTINHEEHKEENAKPKVVPLKGE
jgi:hypothetical protein